MTYNVAATDALVTGAERYLRQARSPAGLTPQSVQVLGLVPLDWFGGEPFPSHEHVGDPIFHLESILRTSNNNAIEVGIEGAYAALKPTIDRYCAQTSAIYFPYPSPLTRMASPSDRTAMLVMQFDRTGLTPAAAIAATGSTEPDQPARTVPSAALAPRFLALPVQRPKK
jgi:hypothetical protein